MNEHRAVLAGAGEMRHIAELGRLASTLGIEVAGVLEQGRRDGTEYLGRGKREELRELVDETGARFVISDDELTASQARVLEKAGGVVRGARLREEGPPTVALVGYTNAGKTTILNALSGARRSTKDRLFETLQTTTRLVEGSRKNGPDGMWPDFVVTDTVGFIRKLPTQLVHSFASTLEVARDADVTVVCADASSEELEAEIQTVTRSLAGRDDGVGTGPMVMCLNKM